MQNRALAKPWPIGRLTILLVVAALLSWWAFASLELRFDQLLPQGGRTEIAREFLVAAWNPALNYQDPLTPESAPAFMSVVLGAVMNTLIFAAAAMSLALCGGFLLGFLASDSWWNPGQSPTTRLAKSGFRTKVRGLLRWLVRGWIVWLRAIHELLWAVLFLAAMGLNSVSAVLAIALPFTGTLAKLFSEILDEAPRHSAMALRANGASRPQVFFFGLLPRALPDMLAYAFYRFECAVRSSAVLGFFGFPTIGFYMRASFENFQFGEVWTYLYALIGLILLLEWWSAAMRRRFVA